MILQHFFIESVNETNSYIVACPVTRIAALVDAGGYDPEMLAFVRRHELKMRFLLVTHDHYDHTDGLDDALDAFPDCEIYAGGGRAAGRSATEARDGATFDVGNLRIRILSVSGHTPDSTAYLVAYPGDPDHAACRALFPGDILFAGSVGGAHGEAHEREIRGIREKILTLPEDTPVFPGHGPATTVGTEKKHNPFLV